MLYYYVSLRSEFRVVMSVTMSVSKRCSVRLYLHVFVGGLMSYLLMFGSSLPPRVCRRAHVLFTLFVFACVW
jgi:hypothetical protein